MDKSEKLATEEIEAAVNRLLRLNQRTAGAEVKEIYLGRDVVVVMLVRPRIVDGRWEDVEKTIDMMDLIDLYEHDDE